VPEFRRKYNNPEWGIMNVLGKCDVVDCAGEYLDDLRNKQMTAFCEIIKGDKPVDYFDTFVEEWHKQGGNDLLKEANEMLKVQNEIYRKVGAVRSSDTPTSTTATALEKR
jgi:putative aldouronate transport system substrate-binding protein